MNALHKKYSKRGLSIVGVTDGDAEKTIPWAEQFGVKYAWAYDQSFFCLRSGIFSYPYAILVDPAGVVVWVGHPTKVTDELIEKHLDGAVEKAFFDWPDDMAEARDLVLEGSYSKALAAAKAKAESDPAAAAYVAVIEAHVKRRAAVSKRLIDAGDFLNGWETAHVLKAGLEGLPEGQANDEWIAAMNTDEKLLQGYVVQSQVRELASKQVKNMKECYDTVEGLDKLSKENPDTIAAKDARNAVNYLNRLLDLGYFKEEEKGE